MSEAERPKIGVGVVIHDGRGNIIMGERAGSHGAGTFQCPGGHLEYGESFAETAARESLEETGLEIGNIKFLTATNDVFGEGKHYVTIFVTAEIIGENKVAQVSCNPRFNNSKEAQKTGMQQKPRLTLYRLWSRTSVQSGSGYRGVKCGSGQESKLRQKKKVNQSRSRCFCL